MSPLNHSNGRGAGNLPALIGIGGRALSIFILGLLCSYANPAWGRPNLAQAPSPANGADPPANSTPKPEQSSSAARNADGAWHHFGEADSASVQPPVKLGAWHFFAPAKGGLSNSASPGSKSAENASGNDTPRGSGTAGSGSSSRSSAVRAVKEDPPAMTSRQTGTGSIRELERQMFALINRDRRTAGLCPVRWNAKLAAVARAHSRDMIRRGYYSHVGPDGRTVGGRLAVAGIDWQAVGENIAIVPTISDAESEFMSEPAGLENHRWNILDPSYTEVGVGIARDLKGDLYVTQDFMRPAPGI